MIPRRDDVLALLRAHAEELRVRFGVSAVSVFGSVGRDEAREDSDVDLLVELSDKPIGLFAWLDLRDYLQALLGRPADVGTPDTLKEPLRNQILEQAVRAL